MALKEVWSFSSTTFCVVYCCCVVANATSNRDLINKYIEHLQYDTDTVLAYEGEKITSFKKKEGTLDQNKNFVVTERTKKTLAIGKADIGIMAAIEHSTFAGSTLVANSQLVNNTPVVLQENRAPIKYTVNLPGLTDGQKSFETVPTYANYRSGYVNVLNTFFHKYPNGSIATDFYSNYAFVYSREQIKVKFGLNFLTSDIGSSIDFDAAQQGKKLILVEKLQREFYTVSVEPPKRPADIFADDVTVEDISGRANNKNPPILVESVSYGRAFFVIIETTSTDERAKNTIEEKLTMFDFRSDYETDWSKVFENFKMQLYVLGCSPDQTIILPATTIKEIHQAIIKYKDLSSQNVGFPLSYSAVFLRDNAAAVIHSTTDYIETTRKVFKQGVLRVEQYGGFVSIWEITWDEVTIVDGEEVITRKGWDCNDNPRYSPLNTPITLAGNCRNIHVKAQFLKVFYWSTIFDREGIPLISRSFKISGLLTDPTVEINPPLVSSAPSPSVILL